MYVNNFRDYCQDSQVSHLHALKIDSLEFHCVNWTAIEQ